MPQRNYIPYLLFFLAALFQRDGRGVRAGTTTSSRKLSKKSADEPSDTSVGYCGHNLYFVTEGSVVTFAAGTPRTGTQICVDDKGCVGDVIVLTPIPIYNHVDLQPQQQVGVYQSTQTLIAVTDDKYDTLGQYAVKFSSSAQDNDGAGELVFTGELDIQEFLVNGTSADLPISGGVGTYLGVTGAMDFFVANADAGIIGLHILCL